jgi:hypothetical protein
MRTASYIALIAAISVGVAPYANAATSKVGGSVASAPEFPLIPLEKTLIPSRSPMEFSNTTAAVTPKDPSHSLANAIVRGLLVANRTGEIAYTGSISYRVQDVVRNLRRGRALTRASRYSGVSYRIVDRLLKLGTYRSDIN